MITDNVESGKAVAETELFQTIEGVDEVNVKLADGCL